MNEPLTFTPTDFVAIANQLFDTGFGYFALTGELSQFRISKNKWVYFDVKDDFAKVSCFGSVYMLPGPLEDGMMVTVGGNARMHPQFGFNITAQSLQVAGTGSLKKAFDLLKASLEKEGLFAPERKRFLPKIPQRVALVTSVESAAYADFIKITHERWPFVVVDVFDCLVQGESAPEQIVRAIQRANQQQKFADALVVTRGGGSADDLAAFNDERVVRAISASRIPTLVAIGHEIDESLSELAADKRASTPSNAAELLLPDRYSELQHVYGAKRHIAQAVAGVLAIESRSLELIKQRLDGVLERLIQTEKQQLRQQKSLLESYNPRHVLSRGYALVRVNGQVVKRAKEANTLQEFDVEFYDGIINAERINKKGNRRGTK